MMSEDLELVIGIDSEWDSNRSYKQPPIRFLYSFDLKSDNLTMTGSG